MRYLVSLLLFFALTSGVSADELTKQQCDAIGGTHTKAGCLVLDESDKAKFGDASTYAPGREECSCQGGTWHETYGCMAKMSKQQCESLGGEMQAEIGCVQKLSEKDCTALGGNLNESGGCALKPQPKLKPQLTLAVNRTCAKNRAVRLP